MPISHTEEIVKTPITVFRGAYVLLTLTNKCFPKAALDFEQNLLKEAVAEIFFI